MDRAQHLEHLKALQERERQLINAPRPYLSREAAKRASERNREAYTAIKWAVQELEGPPRVQVIDTRCPQNFRQESDEMVCTLCGLRWDVHEEKPACRRD